MNNSPLDGQVAFITGAGSGLGAAFASRLAQDGAFVVVNDLDPQAAQHTASLNEGSASPFDVTDSSAFDAAIGDVFDRFGRLDILINNAGIAPSGTAASFDKAIVNQMLRMETRISEMQPLDYLTSLSDQDWDRMIRVHLYGTFYGCRAALRVMQQQRFGTIVNISSILGLSPSAGAAHYSTAKAGIIAFTKSVADETAHLGIRVNAVCPGYIDTPLLNPFSELMMAAIVTRIGLGRLGTVGEIAELVRFLVGPESSYCTGSVFTASGGYNA